MESSGNPWAVAYTLNFSITSALSFLVRPTVKLQALRTTLTLTLTKSEEQEQLECRRLTIKGQLCELLVKLLVFEDQGVLGVVRLHHSNILHPSVTLNGNKNWTVGSFPQALVSIFGWLTSAVVSEDAGHRCLLIDVDLRMTARGTAHDHRRWVNMISYI